MTTGSEVHPTRKIEIRTFATYAICFISLGLAMAALGPMLPSLARNVNVSLAEISFLFTASNLGYLLGSSAGGRLFDRFDSHRLMLLGLGLMVITGISIPLVASFFLLLMVMFIFGLGMGILDVGSNVNVLWLFESRVGPYMNALHFFFGVGALLSPLILSNVMRWAGGAITWPYWALAALFLPGTVGLLLLPSPRNPEEKVEARHVQKPDFKLVVLIMILFFVIVGIEAGFGGWIFTYATELELTTVTAASYLNSLFWAALTLGRLISIPLARRLKPSLLIIANLTLCVISLGMILIWPLSTTVIWIASAGVGLALSSIFPTLLSLAETRMKITGGVTGLFYLGSSLGSTLVPMLLGQIFQYIGHYELMVTLFLTACLGFLALIGLNAATGRVGEKIRS